MSARTEPDLIGDYQIALLDVRERLVPCHNVAPTSEVPAVLARDGGRVLTSARWGLVPRWAADLSIGSRLINARLETVAAKPAFAPALRARRCLLPADAYYEWARDAAGVKRPWLLRAADGGWLTFAGLHETWRDRNDPAAPPLRTVTILTTAAAGEAATVHDRMPVMLPRQCWAAWLDPATTDPDAALGVIGAAPPVELAVSPAHPAVGDVRNDGPHLLTAPAADPAADPVADQAAPTLF